MLHLKYVGKVVAEEHAGLNRKSRCIGSANELCKEGQQMISIGRVFLKNTPIMYDAHSRFPENIHYFDQVEGMANLPVLWCVCHLIEIPPIDQVTRLLREICELQSQESPNSESDFENNTRKCNPQSKSVAIKEKRRGRSFSTVLPSQSSSKGSKSGRRQ